ncbi:MAG: hypothetical protein HRT47_00550 [Candidatus Caenarcaniphilales bacterium]|nr:hypothetical protein [Candidatus Caenarcaniphilales bacterium]
MAITTPPPPQAMALYKEAAQTTSSIGNNQDLKDLIKGSPAAQAMQKEAARNNKTDIPSILSMKIPPQGTTLEVPSDRFNIPENTQNIQQNAQEIKPDTAFNNLSVDKKVDMLADRLNKLSTLANNSQMEYNKDFGKILSYSSQVLALRKEAILTVAKKAPEDVNNVLNDINENGLLLNKAIELQNNIIRDNPPGQDLFDTTQRINLNSIYRIVTDIHQSVGVVSGVAQPQQMKNQSGNIFNDQPRMRI